MLNLQGKVAFVSGAGSVADGWGNGRATAVLLARQGAKVFGTDFSADALAGTTAAMASEGLQERWSGARADMTRTQDVESAVRQCLDQFGRIDILVNNVGGSMPGTPVSLSVEEWDAQMDRNLKTTFLGCKYVLPIMEQQFEREGRGGAIVNVSSIASMSFQFGGRVHVAYAASKAGVETFGRATAIAYVKKGIRVNTVVVGMMNTPLVSERLTKQLNAADADALAAKRNALVPMGRMMGVGNSAHDIAQDLHGHGAKVKMIQRGSITVFSVKAASLNHSIYYNENLSLEDADLIASSNTFPVLLRGYRLGTQRMLDMDKKLLADLHAKGFKLDIGPESGGHQMHVRKNHGGYYLNVGCSDLIISGEVGLLHFENFDKFVPEGALMKDGTVEKADLVVMATGHRSPTDVIKGLLGEEIAQKIGPVWGLDDGGEMCNMYKPTPQKGLWFIGGGFAQSRVWSHYVALQIKAREAGIVADFPVPTPQLDTRTGPPVPYAATLETRKTGGEGAGTDGL